MIEVEFRTPTDDFLDYTAAATLRVLDDGTHTISGDSSVIPLEVTILARDEPSGKIRFDEQPAQWARNCHKIFRTPYLVPVITMDDETTPSRDADAPEA